MTLSVLIAALWVVAASGTAMLPMRFQMVPGLALLVAAPVVIVWLAVDFGAVAGLAALLAFASMFRNPIRYYYNRLRGQSPDEASAHVRGRGA